MDSIAISTIKIGSRHRGEMGDIESLAASILDVGLLHPVVVTPDHVLIAGARRLAACQMLGWKEVPVRFVELADVVRGEIAENVMRKDFLPSEIDAIRRAVEPLEQQAAKTRMRDGPRVGKISPPSSSAGRTRDKIGAFAGVSGKTVGKIAAVMDAANEEPKRFGHLARDMDRTRKVDRAYRELRKAQEAEANANLDEKPAVMPAPADEIESLGTIFPDLSVVVAHVPIQKRPTAKALRASIKAQKMRDDESRERSKADRDRLPDNAKRLTDLIVSSIPRDREDEFAWLVGVTEPAAVVLELRRRFPFVSASGEKSRS